MTKQKYHISIENVLLVLLGHLFLHVNSVLRSSGSQAHELRLTQERHPRGLHPNRHPALLKSPQKTSKNSSLEIS